MRRPFPSHSSFPFPCPQPPPTPPSLQHNAEYHCHSGIHQQGEGIAHSDGLQSVFTTLKRKRKVKGRGRGGERKRKGKGEWEIGSEALAETEKNDSFPSHPQLQASSFFLCYCHDQICKAKLSATQQKKFSQSESFSSNAELEKLLRTMMI